MLNCSTWLINTKSNKVIIYTANGHIVIFPLSKYILN